MGNEIPDNIRQNGQSIKGQNKESCRKYATKMINYLRISKKSSTFAR